MNRIKIIIIFFLVVANLNCRIWIKEYTYNASELDSKVSSRTIALEQVKRLLLQEIGVFVNSELIVEESEVNGILNESFIKKVEIISAGITKTKILEEKWNGEEFYIKAEIEADEIEVLENINKLILDKEKTEQLIVANNRIDDALKKISELNKELKELKKLKKVKDLTDLKFDNHIIKEYQNSIDEISSNDLFQNGIKAANEEKYDNSILLNLKALELNPNFSDAMFNIGQVYNKKGNLNLAIEYWNKTVEINPNYADAIYNIGCIDLIEGRNLDAIERFKNVIKIEPTYTDAYYNLGLAFNNENNKKIALSYWLKTIELDNNYLDAYYNIGHIYNEKGNLNLASEYWNKTAEINPNHVEAIYNIGYIDLIEGRNLDAIERFKNVIKIEPTYTNAYNNLGVSYQRLGQNDKAIPNLIKAAKLGCISAQQWLEENDIPWK